MISMTREIGMAGRRIYRGMSFPDGLSVHAVLMEQGMTAGAQGSLFFVFFCISVTSESRVMFTNGWWCSEQIEVGNALSMKGCTSVDTRMPLHIQCRYKSLTLRVRQLGDMPLLSG